MPLPDGIATVTLAGTYLRPDGTPMRGTLRIRPTAGQIVAADTGLTVQGEANAAFDDNGSVSITVVASDADGINPTGSTYQVTLAFYDAPHVTFPVLLPKTAPTVSLPAITPVTPDDGQYVVITGPQGPAGPQGPPGSTGGTYLHTQNSPAATWQIAHALGRTPNISIIDTGGRVVHADIVHNSTSLAVVQFPTAVAGTAMCS